MQRYNLPTSGGEAASLGINIELSFIRKKIIDRLVLSTCLKRFLATFYINGEAASAAY